MKKFTADQFRQHPALIYRLADKGEKVEIVHNWYPETQFVLVAVPKPEVKDE